MELKKNRIISHLLFLGFFLLFSNVLFSTTSSQSKRFQIAYLDTLTHQNHYSVEVSPNGSYIIGGNEFINETVVKNFHFASIDRFGNVLWQKAFALGQGRVLDIEVYQNFIYATGYLTVDGKKHIFILQLDNQGNYISTNIVEVGQESIALKILVDKHGQNILLAGYHSAQINDKNSNKLAIVISLDRSTLHLNWCNTYASMANDPDMLPVHNMANDIIEIPGLGYFVTGTTTHYNTGFQINSRGVLAEFIGYNGQKKQSLSFHSVSYNDTHDHAGVTPIYDPIAKKIYLLSNNILWSNFQITEIENIFTSPVISQNYHYSTPTLQSEFAAYDMLLNDRGNLIVSGYYSLSHQTTAAENSYYFMIEIDQRHNNVLWEKSWPTYNHQGYLHDEEFLHYYGMGLYPYIYYPELLVQNDTNYFRLGYRRIGNKFKLELVQTGLLGNSIKSCQGDYNTTPVAINHIDILQKQTSVPPINIYRYSNFMEINPPYHLTNSCVLNHECKINANYTYRMVNCSTLVFNSYVTTSGLKTLLWDFGDGNTSTLANPTHIYTNYINWNCGFQVCLTVFNTNGIESCSKDVCKFIAMPDSNCHACALKSGIQKPKLKNTNSIVIYPNPFNDFISIEIPNHEKYQNLAITILDNMGRIILSNKQILDRKTILRLRDYPKGIYFINITHNSEQIFSDKVLKL